MIDTAKEKKKSRIDTRKSHNYTCSKKSQNY